jgi:peptidoglycan/xylan/chitin deacetylase (PgdA/CDA1 family)
VNERIADEAGLSRRRLLRAAPAAVGTVLLAGADPAGPARTARATAKPRAAHPTPESTRLAKPLPVLKRPVFTLHDYRRVVPGAPFPANAVSLTIDDGPHPVWTPKILRLLDKYHVPALFCMIGNQVLGHEDVARSVVRAGHQLANHTWSHPTTLAKRSNARIRQEIRHAQDKIYGTTGYAPTLFRSPGGDWSPAVFGAASQAHLVPLDWSDDPRDWSRPGTAAITRRLMAAKPGQILLCHDGGGDRSQTFTALQAVLPALKARGYQFVPLDGKI